MVFVLVCEKNGVQSFNPFAKHLLPEIGTRVDNKAFAVYFQVHRNAQAFIAEIDRTANLAMAPNYGYALRGAGSEESYDHEACGA